MTPELIQKEAFNWSWLAVLLVQSIVIVAGERGHTEADMVLEKQLRVLHPPPQAAGRDSH